MIAKIRKNVFVLLFMVLLLSSGVCSISVSSSPARIVNGFLTNAFSFVVKWVLSLKTTTKTALKARPMMKFESGYNVETVFDGSKLGIEPYSIEVLADGDLLILDSASSNLYKISSSLSLYSRPKLVLGSANGYSGHIDGKLREAKMNHPKGLTVDDRGNVYIADTDNMAIRKISDAGVTTIAGGKQGRGSGHVDGPSEDAKFSNDFDVLYLGSSCSLLVVDRGNKAIREIQLNFDDCAYQYESAIPLGIALLIVAGILGYLLALLQLRAGSTVSSQDDQRIMKSISSSQYQNDLSSSTRPLLSLSQKEPEKQEGFLGSLVKLVAQAGESAAEMLGGVFPIFNKKPLKQYHHYQYQQHPPKYPDTWPEPVQESFVIREEDEPPAIETRTPTPQKTYAFMSKDSEKMQKLKQSREFYSGWDNDIQKQQKLTKKQHHHHQYSSSQPQTYYEQSAEKTSEVVFGAVQEQRETAVIKPLDHGFPDYDRQYVRARVAHAHGH